MFFKNEGVGQVPSAQTAADAVERLAEKVLAAVESGELRQGFTMREVLRKHWGGATADTMTAALNCAIVDGRLERREVVTTGRPRFGYFTPAAITAADSEQTDATLDLADERDSALLAVAAAESRLRHQAVDYERRIADLTRQATAADTAAREAREMADRVLVAAMEAACFNARLLASRGVEVAS